MVFIISTHTPARFYKNNGSKPVIVDTILLTNKKDGNLVNPPVIADPMQAISELYKAGIPYYPTKIEARKVAVKLELKGFKYLKL